MLKTMGNGVNILGYDGVWDDHPDAPFRLNNLHRIHDAGFRHVRINLFAFSRMDSENRLNPQTLQALDNVVERAILAGLIPIIDEHDADDCQQAPKSCAEKLKAFWSQISRRYADQYRNIVYEILNEPGGNMDREQWNALALDVLKIMRNVDADRVVIVAGLNSDDPQSLQTIDLPDNDRNIILTAHYYKPFEFTHQGAPWAELKTSRKRSVGQPIRQGRRAKRFCRDRSMGTGPAGLSRRIRRYEKAGIGRRANYLSFIARSAELEGWAWACWQFDHDFALFDWEKDRWVAPLLRALLPVAATH
jgi:endoglucanase